MRHLLIPAIALLISWDSCFGQTYIKYPFYDKPPKNALFATFGIMPGFKTTLGQYERVIYQNPDSFLNSAGIKLGVGIVSEWEQYKYGHGTTSSAGIFTFLGKKACHIDFSTGLYYTFPASLEEFGSERPDMFYPSFTLSFRYQKPLEPFILRAGIGFPFELIHLSLGYAF